MDTDLALRKRIMRRVYTVYVLRQITSPALRAGVAAFALFLISQFVSVTSVMSNIAHTSGISGLSALLTDAIVKTELPVQLLLIVVTALMTWFFVEWIAPRSQAIVPKQVTV